jgi:hypothetical protein
MKGFRAVALGIAAAACLVTASAAGAHTTKICWYDEADGSTTFYARNYHFVQSPVGALLIDGASYPFTAAKLGRLPAVTDCQPEACDTIAIPNSYQVVNVPFVSSTVHEIGVTCTNHSDCGWPGCYPMAVDFSPACTDADADGICDDADNCADVANAEQADADADGTGDACDVCPDDPENDADFDGICGVDDNCADVANPGQEDADSDRIGDACDICPFDPYDDADGDSVCGDVDACPETVLPEAVPTVSLGVNRFADTDGDGVFDTTTRSRKGGRRSFTITETAGCSCDQIIAALRLGKGLRRYGCPTEIMATWLSAVSP